MPHLSASRLYKLRLLAEDLCQELTIAERRAIVLRDEIRKLYNEARPIEDSTKDVGLRGVDR